MKSLQYIICLLTILCCAMQTLTAQRPTTNPAAQQQPASTTQPAKSDVKPRPQPAATTTANPPKNEPAKPAKPVETTGPKDNNAAAGNNISTGVTFKNDTILHLKESPKVEVVEINETMSQGQRAGLRVLITLSNAEQVEKSWKEYVKPFKGKTKNAFRDEVFTDNAMITKMSENPVDIYAKVEDSANGTLLFAFFDLGGIYVSSSTNADKFAVAKNIVREFAALQVTQKLESKLAKEEGKLLDIATQRQDMEIQIEQMKLDLESLKDAIYKTEQNIKTTQARKEQKDIETKKQIEVVEQLKKDIGSVSGGGNK